MKVSELLNEGNHDELKDNLSILQPYANWQVTDLWNDAPSTKVSDAMEFFMELGGRPYSETFEEEYAHMLVRAWLFKYS